MLDLDDPKPEEPEDKGRPKLRLVPKGPPVSFRAVEDPETPWGVRAIAFLLAVLLTTVGVVSILATAALLKEYYDRVDAMDLARAEAAAKRKAIEELARPREDGAIMLGLPLEKSAQAPPASPPPSPAPEP